jgi:hypothetical protein
MADTTITGLPNATTPLDGTERVPMDQAGVTVDASSQAIADLAGAAITSAVAAHAAAGDPHPQYLTAAEGNAAYATAAQGTDSREWTAETVSQAEAEAGTATTRRAWTAQRVFQAIAAWWAASSAKTKLDGIEAGAQVNVATDLSYTASSRLLASSTGADATLPLFTSSNAGLVPASGGGTSNFLRADGTFAAPPGGTPGGSTTEVQYNNAGAFAGISTLTYDGTTLTCAGRMRNSYTSIASTPAKAFTGTWFTGGSATTTKPHLLIEPAGTTSTAWSTSGTGLGVNAASGFAGNLLDLQVAGVPQFRVATDGNIYPRSGSTTTRIRGFAGDGNGALELYSNTNIGARIRQDQGYVIEGLPLAFSLSSSAATLFLHRDADQILAQRNGTNAQTFRLYNTLTGTDVGATGNYERGFLRWNTNVLEVGTEVGSGGGTVRPVRITAATLKLPNLPTYADNAAALGGGLVAGDVYKTATGELRITV